MSPADLRAWRLLHHMDQRQAAAVLGMSHANYNRIETGRAGDLALLSTLGRIAALGDTPPDPPPRTGPGRGRQRATQPPPIVAQIDAVLRDHPGASNAGIGRVLGLSRVEVGRYRRRWGHKLIS